MHNKNLRRRSSTENRYCGYKVPIIYNPQERNIKEIHSLTGKSQPFCRIPRARHNGLMQGMNKPFAMATPQSMEQLNVTLSLVKINTTEERTLGKQ